MSDFVIGSGDLWVPYLTLNRVVEEAISNPTELNVERLESELKRRKTDFCSVVGTPGRNASDREELKKSVNEPISLIGHEGQKRLPQQMVHEALLLSDLFDINELHAMDLLVTGEAEMGNYPGWGRGLVAVYIYYEGRYSMITAFNSVMTVCPGYTWGSHVAEKVVDMCNSLVNQVLQDDFMDKILRLMDKFELKKQMELLDANLALGDWRHRTKIMEFTNGIREGLARLVFCWSAQRCITWNDTMRLLEYLSTNILLTEDFKITKEYLLLITAVMFAIENNLSGRDFGKDYAKELRKYYTESEKSGKFQCPELLDLIKLSYFLIIYKSWSERSISNIQENPLLTLDDGQTLIGDDELDFKTDIFKFLKNEVFAYPALFHGEEHVMRQFHHILTGFITFMQMKLKDMKNKSEEAVKTAMIYHEQGISRPVNLARDYENFLEAMGSFYSVDDTYELASDYFRSGVEFVTLCKLVRSSCLDAPAMFVPNVRMLTGFAVSYRNGVFSLLKQNGHNISLEHFFDSIKKYLSNVVASQGSAFTAPFLYKSEAYHRVVIEPIKFNPNEVHGICAYLELLTTVCSNDVVRNYFVTTKKQWLQVVIDAGKQRALPLEIRSRMLEAAAAMIPIGSISTENNMSCWEIFYSTRLVERGTSDLRDELEEKETRLESYALTISFLKLLCALVTSRFGAISELSADDIAVDIERLDGDALEPYVFYVRDAVLLKLFYRSYSKITERWKKATLALNIISNLLDFVPHLMIQMLSESPLLKTCLLLLVDCARVRELSTGPIPHVDDCSFECLRLISRVYDRQASYLYRRDRELEQNWVLLGIHELLQKINGDSGRAEYLIALLKFVDNLNPERNRNLAIHILGKIVSAHKGTDTNMYAALTSDSTLSDIVRHSYIKCISDKSTSEEPKNDVMRMLRRSVVHPSPNFGFFLLGIDNTIEFENPGIRSHPRTLLHAMLENAATLPGAFKTLLTLIEDPRLNGALLRYLRTNQFFVKFFLEEFPQPEMEVECMGYFFKCVAIELQSTRQPTALAKALVDGSNDKFIDILKKIGVVTPAASIPNLEFFEQDLVLDAIKKCECTDRDLRIKLIDIKMLAETFEDEISKLERSTALRLKKSVQGEAKELLLYARSQNETRKTEAAKILLFDCWRQCLEIIVLDRGSLTAAGVDFVTTILRLLTDKMKVQSELSSETFQKLAAETTLVLCAVLIVFYEDLNSTILNKIIQDLCIVLNDEQSSSVRATIHSSLLYVINTLKEREEADSIPSNFSSIIESLCKDVIHANDVGRMQAMYLLGEIIRWNINKGLGGVVHTRTFSEYEPSMRRKLAASPAGLDTSVIRGRSGEADSQNRSIYSEYDSGIPHKISALDSTSRTPNQSFGMQSLLNNQTQTEAPTLDLFNATQTQTSSLFHAVDPERPPNVNVSTRSALMNHLHNRGFLKSVLEEMTLSDDKRLLSLFSHKVDSAQMRALLVFEAKMFMLSRFAKTGATAARILMDYNLIPTLSDMKVFEASTFPEASDPLASMPEDLTGSIGFSTTNFNISSMNGKDTLFVGLFTLLLSMETSSKKNSIFYEQVWKLFEMHDQAFATILEYPACRPGTTEIYCEDSLLPFTTLLARTAKKIPLTAFTQKTKILTKLACILRAHADQKGLSAVQVQIVKNILIFFNNYCTNISIMVEEKKKNKARHCHIVLTAKIDPSFGNTKADELSVGLILKIVHDAAIRLSETEDYTEQTMSDLISIIEAGLTIVYWHVENFLKEMFTGSAGYLQDQQKFKVDLAEYIEDGFVKNVTEACQLIRNSSYVETLLNRLRRLAHLKKF